MAAILKICKLVPRGTFFFMATLQILKSNVPTMLKTNLEFSFRGGAWEPPPSAGLHRQFLILQGLLDS